MTQKIIEIEIHRISVNPYQPRRNFCKEELDELAKSIKSMGIIQPPTVRALDANETQFEIISGERRFRAAELSGLTKIPAVLCTANKDYSAEAALVENIQRVDLNPIEIARALKLLSIEFGYQQDELADRVGKKRSTTANYLRLLALPKIIQESLESGDISMGHAKVILSIEGFNRQLSVHEQIINNNLSVRETEQLAKESVKPPKQRVNVVLPKDCFLEDLQEKIQQRLGTKVTIDGKGKKGRINIDYYNLDDLDRIIELLGLE